MTELMTTPDPTNSAIENEEYSTELQELEDLLASIKNPQALCATLASTILEKSKNVTNFKALELVNSIISNLATLTNTQKSIIDSKTSIKSKRFTQKLKLVNPDEQGGINKAELLEILKIVKYSSDLERNQDHQEKIIEGEYSTDLEPDNKFAEADAYLAEMVAAGELPELEVMLTPDNSIQIMNDI
jgi:hypothetical protein